jgi:hypothetical protein
MNAKGRMPDWLQRHLEDIGVMAPGGITRAARARWCRRCHGPIMSGLDGDRIAAVVEVDPAPLDAAGELLALMSGASTYDLAWRGGRYEIDPRTRYEIAGWPPGSRPGVDVVRAHICGYEQTVGTTETAITRYASTSLPDECPF